MFPYFVAPRVCQHGIVFTPFNSNHASVRRALLLLSLLLAVQADYPDKQYYHGIKLLPSDPKYHLPPNSAKCGQGTAEL